MISPPFMEISKREVAEYSCGIDGAKWYLKPKFMKAFFLDGQLETLKIEEESEKLFGEVICVGNYPGRGTTYYATASLKVYG